MDHALSCNRIYAVVCKIAIKLATRKKKTKKEKKKKEEEEEEEEEER